MRDKQIPLGHKMTLDEYQRLAMGTAAPAKNYDAGIYRGILGLIAELGELASMVKKAHYQGHPWIENAIKEEIGCIQWYLAVLANDAGYGLGTLARDNIIKLQERFPEGFDPERSMHREC